MDRVRPEGNPEAVHDKPRVVLRAKGRCHGNPNVVTTTIRLSACRCVSECAAPETKQKTVGICQTNERNERDEFRFARRAFGRVTGETRRRPTVSLFFLSRDTFFVYFLRRRGSEAAVERHNSFISTFH